MPKKSLRLKILDQASAVDNDEANTLFTCEVKKDT